MVTFTWTCPDFPWSHINPLHLKHQYLLARSTKTKPTTVESLLVASSFFHRNEEMKTCWSFSRPGIIFMDHFSSLKMHLSHNNFSHSHVPFVKVISHLSSPFLLPFEPSPVQTLFLTSSAEDTQYLMCGWIMDFWGFDLLFWLLRTAYFFINPLLMDTAKSFYHHWIWK